MTWDTVPANSIPTSQRSDDWCERLFAYADLETLSEVGFSCGVEKTRSSDYSIPVYDEADATTTRRVWLNVGYPGAFREPRGVKIPWNRKWKPSGGSDHHMVILSKDGGSEWDLWATEPSPNAWLRTKAALNVDNYKAGYRGSSGVVLAATLIHADPQEGNSDGFVVGPLSRGLVRPAEVRRGDVGHALKLVVGSQCSMTGPEAPSYMGVDHQEIGVRYGCAVSPCSIFESRALTGDLSKMVSDGRRFQLMLTRSQIISRLSANGMDGKTLDTAAILAQAMVDYGFFIGHTSKSKANFVADGAAPSEWRDLGVTDYRVPDVMLRGLILSASDLRCLEPPISTLRDGTKTQRSGPASLIEY